MQEAEKVSFNISGAGGSRSNVIRTTLKNVYDAIDEKVLDESMRVALKKTASNYPFQALNNFILNLDKYVSKEISKNSFKNKKEELEFPE